MADHLREFFARTAGLHANIARDVWPDGARLRCEKCGHAEPITTKQAGGYLSRGWPKHCGYTMMLDKVPADA